MRTSKNTTTMLQIFWLFTPSYHREYKEDSLSDIADKTILWKRHIDSKWFLETEEQRGKEAKERKSEKEPSIGQIVQKKNWFTCNWLNTVLQFGMTEVNILKIICYLALIVILRWLTALTFPRLSLRCWTLPGRSSAFASTGPDLTQKGNHNRRGQFFLID